MLVIPGLCSASGKSYNYTFPLGMAYISSTLKSKGFHVTVVNSNHHAGTITDAVQQTIDNDHFDIALSGGTEDTFLQLKQLFKLLKKHKIKSVVGGPILNGEIETIFPYLGADFGIYGEAENVIVDLLKRLHKKEDYASIKSLVFIKDGIVQINPRAPQITDLDQLPYPDFEGFGLSEYLDNTHCNATFYSCLFDHPRIYTICGSRGCVYHCTFCTHTVGDQFVTRSIDSIIEELSKNIKHYRINIVYLVDDMLGNNKQRIIEFCHKFKKLRQELSWDCRWWSNFMCNIIDEELVDILIESGCYIIGLGYESYNSTILKSMNKPTTTQEIDRTFELIYPKKIVLAANFLLGDLNDTKASFADTLEFFKNRSKRQLDFFWILPSLGTKLFEDLKRLGRIGNIINYMYKRVHTKVLRGYLLAAGGNAGRWEHYFMLKKMIQYRHKYSGGITPTLEKKGKYLYSLSFCCPTCGKKQKYNNVFVPKIRSFYYFAFCRSCLKRVTFSPRWRYKIVQYGIFSDILYHAWFILNKMEVTLWTFIQRVKNG